MTRAPRPLPDRLLLVLEPRAAEAARLEPLLTAGARWFWLRAKSLPPADAAALIAPLRPLMRRFGGVLSLGLPAQSAELAGGALHLPGGIDPAPLRRKLGPGALIGCSAHSLPEARVAAAGGADYVTLSPIFDSLGKPGYGPCLGLAGLAAAAQDLPIPVIALGGVTPERVAACRAAGAAAVAVLGGVAEALDPVAALLCFRHAVDAK